MSEQGGVIICGPPGVYRRRILFCPVCERRRRHVVSWDGAWYGTTVYCACGDRWQDGELCPRPWKRGWRKAARKRFRGLWDACTTAEAWQEVSRADVACYAPTIRSKRRELRALRRYTVALEVARRSRADYTTPTPHPTDSDARALQDTQAEAGETGDRDGNAE